MKNRVHSFTVTLPADIPANLDHQLRFRLRQGDYTGWPHSFYIDNVTVIELTSTLVTGLQPDVVEYHDYDPFGMQIENRTMSEGNGYRYGFQGQERDDELKGEGNSLNYSFRMHDPRVGRFFAPDPLTKSYPHYTPYSFSGNKVIAHVELEGLEEAGAIFNDNLAEMAVATFQDIKHSFYNVLTLGAQKVTAPNPSMINWELWAKVAAKQYADYGWLPSNPSPFIKWSYAIDPKTGYYDLKNSRPYIVQKGTDIQEFLGIVGDVVTVALALTPAKVGGLNTPVFLAKNPTVLDALKIASQDMKIVMYKSKHYITNTKVAWKDIINSTKNGPAKFKGTKQEVDNLINEAWDNGTVVNNGKPWKVIKLKVLLVLLTVKKHNI